MFDTLQNCNNRLILKNCRKRFVNKKTICHVLISTCKMDSFFSQRTQNVTFHVPRHHNARNKLEILPRSIAGDSLTGKTMLVQVGFGIFSFLSPSLFACRDKGFFSSCVFICLWAVTCSPPILNSNISPFPPATSRLRCMHIYEVRFHEPFSFFFFFLFYFTRVWNERRLVGDNKDK